MRKKLLLSFCAWIFALIAGLAQTTTVTGKVTDDKGKPIEGAAVVEKKSKGGTATDANGVFKLTVKPGAILVISGTGFEKREVAERSQQDKG